MRHIIAPLVFALVALFVIPAFAAPLRVFVSDVNTVGAQNGDELRQTLQTLLASRLNGDSITAVGDASEADVIVSGAYVVIGKVFSVDALVKSIDGKTLTRAYMQGENQDELIPAVGKLAEKLSGDLLKLQKSGQIALVAPVAVPASSSSVVRPQAPSISEPRSDIVKNVQPQEIIRPKEMEYTASGGWQSRRLPGAANLIAVGNVLPNNGREVFLAEDRRLSYYRQDENMKLLYAEEFANNEKIISLDTFQGSDGRTEIYLTIMRGDDLASQVLMVDNGKLSRVASGLPYYFRALTPFGGPRKIYAQATGRDTEFYGNVAEVRRNGSSISLVNPVKMPSFGNIFTFNQLKDQDGKTLTVVIHPDGYLIVYDENLSEIWRGDDKYGQSELFYQKDNTEDFRLTNDRYRWFFTNQRIQVTSKGEVLVGKNDGFWVVGNARSYKKGAVYCFRWNGSNLDEQWHTRETQSYMPDYYYDESRNELLILQTVQRAGITNRGAASLAIKKVE